MGLDMYKIPYKYFGDNEVRKGNLRAQYDVILYPDATVAIDGAALRPGAAAPQPYRKRISRRRSRPRRIRPTIAAADSARRSDGTAEVRREGGVLITEGTTTQTFVQYAIAPGVTVEDTNGLYVPGAVIKTLLGDKTSPILYGYDQNALAVLVKGDPGLTWRARGGGFGRGGGGGRGGGLRRRRSEQRALQPMSAPARLTTLEGGAAPAPLGTVRAAAAAAAARRASRRARCGRGSGGRPWCGRGRAGGAARVPGTRCAAPGAARAPGRWRRPRWTPRCAGAGGAGNPRVLLVYPADANDLLLSGELVGGEITAGKAALVDAPMGKGHMVLFTTRPFWRNEAARQLLPVVQRDAELERPRGEVRTALRRTAYGSRLGMPEP
jgi:hypothetical protein